MPTATHVRHLPSLVALLLVCVTLLVGQSAPAGADVGDCKKVYGRGGTASKGFARVCLDDFSSSGGWAQLRVTEQKRRSAPHNVYVKAGFYFGGYNTGTKRLGKNAPKTYTKIIYTNVADPVGVVIRLCYDRAFRSDPCFKTKTIDGDWVIDGGS